MKKSTIVAWALAAVNLFQFSLYNNQQTQIEQLKRELARPTATTYTQITSLPKATATPRTQSATVQNKAYVANINSGVYHKATCSSVKQMYDRNKKYYSSSYDAKLDGYTPCKRCNP